MQRGLGQSGAVPGKLGGTKGAARQETHKLPFIINPYCQYHTSSLGRPPPDPPFFINPYCQYHTSLLGRSPPDPPFIINPCCP